ncbi:MAG: TIGR04372 family glycosyltransferase [Bdellovibrionota bacterium]
MKIGEKSSFFVFSTGESTIGNTAEEIYYALIHARRSGKKLLLLRRYSLFGLPQIANTEIFKLDSPHFLGRGRQILEITGNLLISALFGHLPALWRYVAVNLERLARFAASGLAYVFGGQRRSRPRFVYRRYRHLFFTPNFGLELLWNPSLSKTFSWETVRSYEWGKQIHQPLSVAIRAKKAVRARSALQRMGIERGRDWYVCWHVREGGFRSDKNSPRNGDIMLSVKAMQAIVQAGGWVVRLGDKTMTRLPKLERVIDYPFSEFKSELMDLYLIQNCRFYVGMPSGPIDIAHLFQKQTLSIGSTETVMTPTPRKNTLAIKKHVYSRQKQRFLSLKEQMGEPYSMHQLYGVDEDYLFIENSPDEICDAVMEAFERSQDPDREYSALQIEFIRKREEMVRGYFSEVHPLHGNDKIFGIDLDVFEKYRHGSRVLDSKGTLGQKFLESYWEKPPQLQVDSLSALKL